METDPIKAISAAIESAENTREVGMLSIKSANQTLVDASSRKNPDELYHSLWYEGEVGCLFADSNLGKSLYAVQIAAYIASDRTVLYLDCELSDKQFQLRYTDRETGLLHEFPEGFLRAEINPAAIDPKHYEEKILQDIENAMLQTGSKVGIIDNISYLCNATDKGVEAGNFMMNLMNLKRKYGWSLLIIAHTPKRSLSSPITQNDLGGSKKLFNFFDSVIAIGQSAKKENIKYVKQLKIRSGENEYGAGNVILYSITHDEGWTHFKFEDFGEEADHLRNRAGEQHEVELDNVASLKKEGKSVRQIAGILGFSKSKVDRLIKELAPVPSQTEQGQEGQPGHEGQQSDPVIPGLTGDLNEQEET